jgi:hypothetical protein
MTTTPALCRNCDNLPYPFSEPEPIHEGHISARFGDHKGGSWEILLDGEDIAENTTEAITGDPGMVLLIPGGRIPRCRRCEAAPLFLITYGKVEIRRIVTAIQGPSGSPATPTSTPPLDPP